MQSERVRTSDAAALVEQVEISAGLVRAHTKKLYRDAELLRRLTAQHDDLVRQLVETTDTSKEEDTET